MTACHARHSQEKAGDGRLLVQAMISRYIRCWIASVTVKASGLVAASEAGVGP